MTTVSLFWHNCHTTSRKTERICDKHASYGRTLLKYCIDAAGRNTTPNPKRIQEKILFANFWGTQTICWSISDFSFWWWRFIDFWQNLDKIPPVQNLTTISLKLPHQQMNKKSKINASPWHLVLCQALDYNVRTSLRGYSTNSGYHQHNALQVANWSLSSSSSEILNLTRSLYEFYGTFEILRHRSDPWRPNHLLVRQLHLPLFQSRAPQLWIMDGVHVVKAFDELDRPGDGNVGNTRKEVPSSLDTLNRFKERRSPEESRWWRCC